MRDKDVNEMFMSVVHDFVQFRQIGSVFRGISVLVIGHMLGILPQLAILIISVEAFRLLYYIVGRHLIAVSRRDTLKGIADILNESDE